MLVRTISGIVLFLILLTGVVLGGWTFWGLNLVISLVGMFELYRVFGVQKNSLGILGYVACITYYLNIALGFTDDVMLIGLGFLLTLLFVYVCRYPKYDATQAMGVLFGFYYVGVMLSFMCQTRAVDNHGMYLFWLIIICSWGCDTCAYLVGSLIGKHKMAPKLSPKKSVEGAIGGVVGSVLISLLVFFIVINYTTIEGLDPIGIIIITTFGAIASMVGDLAASAIKRSYNIKDYGKLIPGHGGIMDRFDSVIVTAPMIYFLAIYIL